MKFWHLLLLLSIILILILILAFQYPEEETYKQNTDDIKTNRDEIGLNYFNDTFPSCHDVPISSSYGLLVDSLIVCSNSSNILATPYFYFEELPEKFYKNGWYFVNLDVTNFQNFDNTPHNIICKTKQCYDILHSKFPNKNIIYTGFTSIDRYKPDIKKDYTKFIHVAGKSPWKGTINIINAWKKHPEWPQLLLIWRKDPISAPINEQEIQKIRNITLMNGYLSDKKLDELINKYGIHICASEHEGFGHYINESRAVKAVTLYSDAPCMNEFFTEKIGIPIKTTQTGFSNHGFCPKYETSVNTIEEAVLTAINTPVSELVKMGTKAREQFIKDDILFKTTLNKQIKGSKKIPHITHFIWISNTSPYENTYIPERYRKFINSWNYNNNTFTYNFWSGKQILDLIQNNFPEFVDFYKTLETVSSKCDFAKLCVLYSHGGICADLSITCKKDITPLLETDSYCIIESVHKPYKSISTNFIASHKENEFIYGALDFISNKNPGNQLRIPDELYNYFTTTKYTFLVGDINSLHQFISKNMTEQDNNDQSKKFTKLTTSSKDLGGTTNFLEEQGVNLPQKEIIQQENEALEQQDISRNTTNIFENDF